VELVIRIALMFFFIQFLVLITIMSVALMRARPEVPVCRSGVSTGGPKRSQASALHLPSVGFRAIAKRVRSVHYRNDS